MPDIEGRKVATYPILFLNITVLYFSTLPKYHNTERFIAINITFVVLGATYLI